MSTQLVEELAFGLKIDNALMAQAIAAGEQVTLTQTLELVAAARALFNTVALASRGFDRVQDCYKLWLSTRDQFDQLCRIWDDVPQNGELIA
jgi:hypothetical protein